MFIGHYLKALQISEEYLKMQNISPEIILLILRCYYELDDMEKCYLIIKFLNNEKIEVYDDIIKKIIASQLEVNKEDLYDLIEEIKAKQSKFSYYKDKYPDFIVIQNFINWLKECKDSFFTKLQIKFFSENHRGVFAKAKIYKEEAILRIPYEKLITLEYAKETPVGLDIINNGVFLQSPKHCFLAIVLLQEKINNDSKWKHYIDVLPKSYNNFPVFFNDNELEYLKGSPFLNLLKEKLSDLKKDYNAIFNCSELFKKFSFKDFCEARMAVSSRIFGIKVGGVKTDCLCPLADMLNHRSPRQTQWFYSDQLNSFIIQAIQEIEIDDEIFDSYGKKCNSRFLLNYGFVLEKNDRNEFPFNIQVPEEIAYFDFKFKDIEDNKFSKIVKTKMNIEDDSFQDLLSILRYIYYEEDFGEFIGILCSDMNVLIKEKKTRQFYLIPPISIDNELKILSILNEICYRAINEYDSTIEEDEKLLKSGLKNENVLNSIIMRIGEKKILSFYIELCSYCINLFKLKSSKVIF